MALVWVLIEVMFVFLYFQSPPVEEEEEEEKVEGATKSGGFEMAKSSSPLLPKDEKYSSDQSHEFTSSIILKICLCTLTTQLMTMCLPTTPSWSLLMTPPL